MCNASGKCDAQKLTDIYNQYEKEYYEKWKDNERGHDEDRLRTWIFFMMLRDSRLNIRIKDR